MNISILALKNLQDQIIAKTKSIEEQKAQIENIDSLIKAEMKKNDGHREKLAQTIAKKDTLKAKFDGEYNDLKKQHAEEIAAL